MSGVAVLNYLLSNAVAVTAVVPAERIFSGPIPQGVELPAIGITSITDVERLTVSMAEASRFQTERVQVTVHTRTYGEKKPLLRLIRTACAPKPSGTVNGVSVDSIIPEAGEGPDLDDPGVPLFERSRDFFVRWNTAA